jgi:hypothetical protein
MCNLANLFAGAATIAMAQAPDLMRNPLNTRVLFKGLPGAWRDGLHNEALDGQGEIATLGIRRHRKELPCGSPFLPTTDAWAQRF